MSHSSNLNKMSKKLALSFLIISFIILQRHPSLKCSHISHGDIVDVISFVCSFSIKIQFGFCLQL